MTGGAGFIGHHVVGRLVKRGYDVVVLDNLSRARDENVSFLRGLNVKVIVGDVLGDLSKVFEPFRPDAVIHAAALINVEESFSNPVLYNRVNVEGTLRLLEKSLRHNCYFLFLSSAAVYGNPKYLPIDEDHPTRPLSPYGVSKLAAELYVKVYSRCGLKASIFRLFNVYGSGQNPEYAGVITKFIERIKLGKPLVIYGDGKQTRDFINVRDVVEAIVIALEKKVEGVFNIGCGRPVSVIDLAKLLSELVGRRLDIVFEVSRRGDIRHSYANINRAVKVLGWKPRISLEEGLLRLLKYYNIIG